MDTVEIQRGVWHNGPHTFENLNLHNLLKIKNLCSFMDFSLSDKTLALTVDVVSKDHVRMRNKKYSSHRPSHYEDILQLIKLQWKTCVRSQKCKCASFVSCYPALCVYTILLLFHVTQPYVYIQSCWWYGRPGT